MDSSGSWIWEECEDVCVGGLPTRLPDVGRRAEKGPLFLPKCVGCGGAKRNYFSVKPKKRASGDLAVTCRAGREVKPWGSEARTAGRVPGGRGARLPAQPRVSGSSMATRRRCHRATRSRPTFKSKWLNLQGLGGKRDPLSQVGPEGCSPHGNPGDSK